MIAKVDKMFVVGKIVDKNKKAIFRAWFNRGWAEWDSREGRRTTQIELSAYLDVSRSAIAQYVSGRQVPEGDNLRKIAKKFGDEIYDLLDITKPLDEFSQFPPDLAGRLRAASSEITDLLNSGKIAPNSPEHERVAREIFQKHGFDLTDIEIRS